MLLNQSLNLGGRSADKLVGSLGVAILEDVEGGHGLDAVLSSKLGVVVDIDLDKVNVGELVGPSARARERETVSQCYVPFRGSDQDGAGQKVESTQ